MSSADGHAAGVQARGSEIPGWEVNPFNYIPEAREVSDFSPLSEARITCLLSDLSARIDANRIALASTGNQRAKRSPTSSRHPPRTARRPGLRSCLHPVPVRPPHLRIADVPRQRIAEHVRAASDWLPSRECGEVCRLRGCQFGDGHPGDHVAGGTLDTLVLRAPGPNGTAWFLARQ
ncbi:hypothetical protein ACFCXH_12725 [Streptomyces nojiriensis]|uniref:hypothetical protein n=1 Tax=Streptomyces nojiriensis TaxID=66374 RepID=UPI0035D9C826